MKIRRLDPKTETRAWDAFVDTFPTSTVYHRSEWLGVVERAYGIVGWILIAEDDAGAIVGGMPLFRIPRPFQAYLSMGIFGAYGAILARTPEAQAALADEVLKEAAREKAPQVHLRTYETETIARCEADPRWKRHEVWLSAILEFGATTEDTWKAFPGPIRTKTRKAQKEGLSVRTGAACMDDFYDVLAENMHRKGSPIYGQKFMEEILAGFGADAEVICLYQGDEAVSGALVLKHKGMLYVPFVSSRPKYFPLRPNNLLYWEIIQWGQKHGATALDFGTSLKGHSTFDFKLSYGAKPVALVSYTHSSDGSEIILEPSGVGLQLVMGIWKRMPRATADWLGPKLSRVIC